MDRRLRNRIIIFLLLAGVVAFVLVQLSRRQPPVKITAVAPARANIASSVTSNGKVEPIAPVVIRAQTETFIQRVAATEGQQVKKGQLLLELDVKDASAQLAQARAKLLRAQNDLKIAQGGDRKSTRLNSSHVERSYAVFCLKKKNSLPRAAHSSSDHRSRHPTRSPRPTPRRPPC